MKSTRDRSWKFISFQRKHLGIPYAIFLLLFIIIPITIIIFYAFTYEYFDSNTGETVIKFSFQAFLNFFQSTSKIRVLLMSVFIAFETTLLCLLIGFPLAYCLADSKINKNATLVTLFIAPMWINFVLRTGATRDLLGWMGITTGDYPYLATFIGMIQNYLPFVILPLYTTFLKLDKYQIEACKDLGCNPLQVFYKNILWQALPGILSAATMTFMPTMSSYVISETLSEGKITLIGSYINLEFDNKAWNDGSFMALIMLVIIGLSVFATKFSEREKKESVSL